MFFFCFVFVVRSEEENAKSATTDFANINNFFKRYAISKTNRSFDSANYFYLIKATFFLTQKFSHENDKYFNYDALTKKLFIFVAFKHTSLWSFRLKEINASWCFISSSSSLFAFKILFIHFLYFRVFRSGVWNVAISKKSFMSSLDWRSFPGTQDTPKKYPELDLNSEESTVDDLMFRS